MSRTSLLALYAPDIVGTEAHLTSLDELRAHGDVVEVDAPGPRRTFVVVGHHALSQLASSPSLTSRYGVGLVDAREADDDAGGVPFRAVNSEDGASHSSLRALLAPLGVVDGVALAARNIAREVLVTSSFHAHDFVAAVQLGVVGYRFGARDSLVRVGRQLAHEIAFAEHDGGDVRALDDALVALADTLLEQDATPGSLLHVVKRAVRSREIARVDAAWLVRFAFLTAFVTTELAAVRLLLELTRTPADVLWRLVLDVDRADAGRLRSRFVDECLRVQSPVARFGRVARDDIHVDGAFIPRGARVILSFAGANHDSRVFSRPRAINVDIDAAHHASNNDGNDGARSFPFGAGPHACLGAGVAVGVLRGILNAVCDVVSRQYLELACLESETLRSGVNRGERRALLSWRPISPR